MATSPVAAGRFRVGDAAQWGTRLVTDLVRLESFWVYQPLNLRHQLGGHESGRWYFRALGVETDTPVSCSYATFDLALCGLKDSQAFKDYIDGIART